MSSHGPRHESPAWLILRAHFWLCSNKKAEPPEKDKAFEIVMTIFCFIAMTENHG